MKNEKNDQDVSDQGELVHVQEVLHGGVLAVAARVAGPRRDGLPGHAVTNSGREPEGTATTDAAAQGEYSPSAGDLLIRAVDRAMQHGMSCTLEDCPACDAGFNQIRLAYKVWTNSHHVRDSGITNTKVDHVVALADEWLEFSAPKHMSGWNGYPSIPRDLVRNLRNTLAELCRAFSTHCQSCPQCHAAILEAARHD